MHQSEFDTREPPSSRESFRHYLVNVNLVWGKPQFFGFVHERHASMHCLHAQHLVVALLVVEHRSCEIVEDILGGQGAVGLAVMDAGGVRNGC